MSSVYNPVPVPLGGITIPSDGDARSAASVNVPLEAIADGVACTTSLLATLAALTALAAPADGDIRHVLGYGLFVFKTSATTGLAPFRLAADDATAGGWISETAHQTTLTRYVPANRVIGMTGAAQAPALAGPFTGSAVPLFRGGGSFAGNSASTSGTNAWGFLIPIDEFLVHGATLASVALTWTSTYNNSPAVKPQFGVCRTARSGYNVATIIPDSLLAAGFLVDPGGAFAIGTTRAFTLTTDQNQTIDLATYAYSIVLYEQHGLGAAADAVYHSFAIAMTDIPDARR